MGTFGKAHGAGDPDLVGPEPEGSSIQDMGFGWINKYKSGKVLTQLPVVLKALGHQILLNGIWVILMSCLDMTGNLLKSPAGANIWHTVDLAESDHAPEVDGSGKKVQL